MNHIRAVGLIALHFYGGELLIISNGMRNETRHY